jgi:hypothetical protein
MTRLLGAESHFPPRACQFSIIHPPSTSKRQNWQPICHGDAQGSKAFSIVSRKSDGRFRKSVTGASVARLVGLNSIAAKDKDIIPDAGVQFHICEGRELLQITGSLQVRLKGGHDKSLRFL